MKELKPRIHENGMDYVLVGDYYVPDLKLPEEHRPIGHWGRLHQSYLKQFRPMVYSDLLLSGKLHTVLADLNEQATDRLMPLFRISIDIYSIYRIHLERLVLQRLHTLS